MPTFINPFVKKPEEYVRDIDMLRHYAQDQAMYLHLQTGKPLEVCQRFVADSLKPGGRFAFKDPTVEYLQRGENGDRSRQITTLSAYLRDSLRNREQIAPTLTTYLNPKQKKSLLSIYIQGNILKRGKAKKAQFIAGEAGNKALANIKKIEQTGRKLANNAISGAHVSPSTPLFNKTGHSTLTSVCRSTSGYGNANNEKFLTGNRHYFTHHLVLNNIVSIVRNTDYPALQAVLTKYTLHVPTVQETIECVRYSTALYWTDAHFFAKIEALIARLTPLQRAAFVYTGDMHHLRKFNAAFVRQLIEALSTRVEGPCADPDSVIHSAPEDHVNLGHLLCRDVTKGIGKDYSKIVGTPGHTKLALTIAHIGQVVTEYADLIQALWVTSNLPASVAHFPTSIRRSALTSDTDSTIFTVQDWTLWYHGRTMFDPAAVQVGDVMAFLASATITNVLAVMSANFGIATDRLHAIAMKNEFKFDVFVPTQVGKHYFADISSQEGNVKKDYEVEIKGVQLKSSNAPRPIIKQATAMMKRIMAEVRDKGSLSLTDYIAEVVTTERAIYESIQKGESTYLRASSIKDAEGYKGDPEDSPFKNHSFWNETFGYKYGIMPEPPYATLKVSVTLDTKAKLTQWLCQLDDRELANRLSERFLKTDTVKLTTVNLPMASVISWGIPQELLIVIDYNKIIGDICKIFYLILETIGLYSNGDKRRQVLSTLYPALASKAA